jgi:hypothetical protein
MQLEHSCKKIIYEWTLVTFQVTELTVCIIQSWISISNIFQINENQVLWQLEQHSWYNH